MKISNEVKAGVVVLAALLIGAFFFLKTANFQTRTYELKTYFKFAGDLKKDAVVKLAGIEAGRVTTMNFLYDPETKVECIITLNDNIKVRQDSIAYIGTAGFVGDAYIGITGGAAPEFLNDGDTVTSEEPVQMREVMKEVGKTLQEVQSLAANVNGVVKDNKPGIDKIISNVEVTTANLKEFSEDVKKHPWKLLFKGE